MYESLKGRKILILGGLKMACNYVLRAQKMGCYVYVADYEEDSPAKKLADKAILLDVTDIDGIVQFCIAEKIDGITTGYVDILLPVCLEACRQLNLPCYVTDNMLKASTDKTAFKKMCHTYDVPVPKSYYVTKDDYKEMSEKIEYPVFVKPLDASGSRGAGVCYSVEDFITQFESALSFSKKKEVIVEEYLKGTDFILDYVLIDGEAYLFSMFDRKICSDRPSAINHANLLIAPSHKIDTYVSDVHPKVTRMFKEMGFENGLIFLQGYIDGDRITFFEMGCRLGGTFPDIDEYYVDINPMDMLIHYAITGKMTKKVCCKKFNAKFDGKAAVINLLVQGNGNVIGKIEGLDEVERMPEVVQCIRYMEEGDFFVEGSLTDRPVVILYVVASEYGGLKNTIQKIYDTIKVYDEKNRSLLLPVYAVEELDDSLYL